MSDEKYIYGKNVNTGTNYGNIGDQYHGIKQRIFTESDFIQLEGEINTFKKKYSERIKHSHITVGFPADNESHVYGNQICNALIQNGYNIIPMGLKTDGFVDKNFSVSNAPDDSILVEIFHSPNV